MSSRISFPESFGSDFERPMRRGKLARHWFGSCGLFDFVYFCSLILKPDIVNQ